MYTRPAMKRELLANSERSRGRECVHESGARDQQLDMNYASLCHVRRDVTSIHYASMQACESVSRRRSVPRRFLSRGLRSRDTRAGTNLASRYRPLSKLSSHSTSASWGFIRSILRLKYIIMRRKYRRPRTQKIATVSIHGAPADRPDRLGAAQ